jgi:uncharacterized membrane protein
MSQETKSLPPNITENIAALEAYYARQERRAGTAQRVELQVNILTEQKTTKLVHLLEELRRDLPMVRDRHDADATKLQQPTDATEILSALEKKEEP